MQSRACSDRAVLVLLYLGTEKRAERQSGDRDVVEVVQRPVQLELRAVARAILTEVSREPYIEAREAALFGECSCLLKSFMSSERSFYGDVSF